MKILIFNLNHLSIFLCYNLLLFEKKMIKKNLQIINVNLY